jgi:Tfp pilus assembly protein PilV
MIIRLESERGTSLIETAIATGILLVVMAGLLGMAALATTYTENHGHLEARTTEYAQDKMEQLLTMAFTDSVSNTVTFPTSPTGGTGLAVGGGVVTATPVNGYVDWLAQNGDLLGGGATPPAAWFYERVWQVCYLQTDNVSCLTTPATGVKRITVTTTVRSAVGGALIPKSTVVSLKASQF